MKLNLKFSSNEAGLEFLSQTRETDLSSVNAGLINLALKAPGLVSCETVGDPIEFYVLKDGDWSIEVVADPVTRIKAGEVMEPANVSIKMLSDFTSDMTTFKTRISNRYVPFVSNPYFADVAQQRTVEIILVDSGVNKAHVELSNATINDLYKVPAFADFDDTNGHGTALASLMVGKNLSVNPNAVVQIVKISDGTRKPTLAELGDAIDAIYDHHMLTPLVPKVVNMSWSIPSSLYISTKITRLITSGLMVVAAGGNTPMNIDDVTPAGLTGVFTVAASTEDDRELVALYGINKKIDMYAPGENVGIANFANTTDYKLGTGSSYSAAIVSGVASMLFGLSDSTPAAAGVIDTLQKDSTFNALILNDNVSVDENRLLHRPDTNSISATKTQFLGCIPVDFKDPMTFDLKILMPYLMFNSDALPILSIVRQDADTREMLDITIEPTGGLSILIKPGTTIPGVRQIKQLSFSVAAAIPGVTCETTTCYVFLATVDARSEDARDALTGLNAITEFAFLEDADDSGPEKVKDMNCNYGP